MNNGVFACIFVGLYADDDEERDKYQTTRYLDTLEFFVLPRVGDVISIEPKAEDDERALLFEVEYVVHRAEIPRNYDDSPVASYLIVTPFNKEDEQLLAEFYPEEAA